MLPRSSAATRLQESSAPSGACRPSKTSPTCRYSHTLFLPRIWELRHNVTAYDAAYLALAEILAAPLVTRNASLASAAGHSARIELV